MRSKYTFGKRLALFVTEEGFSLWDAKEKLWIIDGSLASDPRVDISVSLPLIEKSVSRNYHFRRPVETRIDYARGFER